MPGNDPAWRWLTASPALLLALALGILPLLHLLGLSLVDVSWADGRSTWRWVGLDNYVALGRDTLFRAGLANTAVFALVAVAGQVVLGFGLALLSTRVRRGRLFYRTVFILPILIPGIVIGAIWKLILNYDFGPVTQLLAVAGLQPFDWLGDPGLALVSVILVDIWHWTPFCFLLMLAGLEALPVEVSEAARTDGARGWQELLWITLPLMAPTIVVTFAFRLVLATKVFDEVYLLTGGGPGTATEVLSFTIYQRFFTEDRAGPGAAMGVAVIFIVSLLLVVAVNSRRGRVA